MNYSQSIAQTETALSYLIEATKRKKSKSALVTPIKALDAKIGDIFIRQGNALVRALSPIRKLLQEDKITKQFDAIFDDATETTSIDMLDALLRSYKAALTLGAEQQLAEIGVKISFKLDNPRAARYIQAYGADQISAIDAHTKADIRNLLSAAVQNGDSYNELAAAIKARYKHYAVGVPQQHIRSRAHLIAVTEIGNGYQAGNHASMQATQDAGIKMQKRWLTVGDTRVSDGCKTNAGQSWIALNIEHISGDLHPLRFPGCRCVEQYQRASKD